MQSLLAEAGSLALAGGATEMVFTSLAIYLFRRAIVSSLGLPFRFPPLSALLAQIGAGLLLALVSVMLAALVPAYRISRQDPAIAMRE